MELEAIKKTDMLELCIVTGFCTCYITGMCLYVLPSVKKILFQSRENRKRNSDLKAKKESNFDRELCYMLNGSEVSITPKLFKYASSALFVIVCVLAGRILNLAVTVTAATLIAATPYLYLKLRLERARSRSSHEAETLISNLLIQYRISSCNIEATLEKVINSDKISATKKPLFTLLLTLRSTRNKREIKEAADGFAFHVGTLWARMLSHNIYNASISGINISLSLEDILAQLKEARTVAEERKRINAESNRMLWLIPVVYIGSVFLGVNYCNITVQDFIYNQFNTTEGMSMFSFILVMTIIDCYLMTLTKQKRFDF